MDALKPALHRILYYLGNCKASEKNQDFSSCIAVVRQKAEESDPPEFPACVPVAIIEEDQSKLSLSLPPPSTYRLLFNSSI